VKAPESVGFQIYNNLNEYTSNLIKSVNYSNITIPYRSNRMVMFDSDLLHHTDHFHFQKGYCNRRINLTFLYGTMGEKCWPQEIERIQQKQQLQPWTKITFNILYDLLLHQ
jgi:hypothetical protein